MSQKPLGLRMLGFTVFVALALLIGCGLLFALILTMGKSSPPNAEPVSAESYRARVDALLAIGHAADAEAVFETMGCLTCHRNGEENTIAPSWVGIAARAATRRPPMPADAYIYELITNPSAYVVDGYTDLMPGNFSSRLTDQQLADVIAFLLTPDAQ